MTYRSLSFQVCSEIEIFIANSETFIKNKTKLPAVLSPGVAVNLATSTIFTANA